MPEIGLTRHALSVACAPVGVGAFQVTFHAISTTIGRVRITWPHSLAGRHGRNDDQSAVAAFVARSDPADPSKTPQRRGRQGSSSMSSTYAHTH